MDIPLKLKYRAPKPKGHSGTRASTGKRKVKLKEGYGPRRRAYGPFWWRSPVEP